MERPPSKKTSRELVEKVVEGGVSMVPIAGGPMAVAFAYAVDGRTTAACRHGSKASLTR